MSTNRKFIFANEEIYHVYNRGVDRRPVFTQIREFQRAEDTFNYYRFSNLNLRFSKYQELSLDKRKEFLSNLSNNHPKLVDIISDCLMPNHFHFLLKQKEEDGISTFLANFTNSYTKYFNTRHDRTGSLFQGPFKATIIESDEQLLHVSRYIHLNPVVANLVTKEKFDSYPWSSLKEFLNEKENGICDKSQILTFFSSPEKYRNFLYDQIDYAKSLKKIEHLVFD